MTVMEMVTVAMFDVWIDLGKASNGWGMLIGGPVMWLVASFKQAVTKLVLVGLLMDLGETHSYQVAQSLDVSSTYEDMNRALWLERINTTLTLGNWIKFIISTYILWKY